jgi:hypothetical protein
LAVCRDTDYQWWTPVVVTDGGGGAIIAWQDLRWASGPGTCAQRVVDAAGVTESTNAEVRATNSGPTVVRAVLALPERTGSRLSTSLLDITGQKVLELRPGANDARALAPGVYFVREEPQAASHKPQAVRKVIVTR